MPVDLNSVPAKLATPDIPRFGLWTLMAFCGSLLVSFLIALYWPQAQTRQSLWFWAGALVLPQLAALSLFALGYMAYERRRIYVANWNQQQDEHLQRLMSQGQQAFALLAASYVTGAGSQRLAQFILRTAKLRRTSPEELHDLSEYSRQLLPSAVTCDEHEYCRRLQIQLTRVLHRIKATVRAAATDTVLQVRIRHDGSLSDESLQAQWCEAAANLQLRSEVQIAEGAEGLLWLDNWLDDEARGEVVLSLEINLFQQPVAGQGESVSAVLLARSAWARQHRLAPFAWVHRPVAITEQGDGLGDALRWGGAGQLAVLPRTWHSQLDSAFMPQLTHAMSEAYQPFDLAACQDLDECLGAPNAAVGNMALIVAGEQAFEERKPQLVLLQDAGLQACVIRPI